MSKDLLRFSIIGNVDDGKSTLLGRLLFDTGSIADDQMQAIEESSKRRGEDYVNLALLTDGLKAEREQGITIDVAYRYFSTAKRKFIIADCPGHAQYTRNMVTGTSTAQASVILVDARHGLTKQTKRHAFIASMMGVKHLIVCVNKMDLVDFKEQAYEKVKESMSSYLSKLDIQDVQFIPMNALDGDNVVNKSEKMKWYQGSSLLYMLENLHLASDFNHVDCRFPVQRVIRPMSKEFHDFRGFAGRVESGVFKPGDGVLLLPSGIKTKVAKIFFGESEVEEAFYPMSVIMTLTDEKDLSRGDLVVRENNQPNSSKDLDLLICWFSENELDTAKKYIFLLNGKYYPLKIKEVLYVLNVETLHRETECIKVRQNDIARVQIKTNKNIFFDLYKSNKNTGSIVLIDQSNNTVASCIIR